MTALLPERFTHSHVVADDGSRQFACATDAEVWPWLALPPADPIVVQTLNYYAAHELAVARGEYDPGQWSALTVTRWTCGDAGAGHAVRGEASAPGSDGSVGYRMRFFDRNDALVYTMSGDGVVFRDRDFESWRAEQKKTLDTSFSVRDFPYVSPEAVGVTTPVQCFIAAPVAGAAPSAMALVTMENGFLPRHPYHSGSGDHVNATHLADAGRQFLRLLHGDPDRVITAGEMQFQRYVELGHPFRITLTKTLPGDGVATLTVTQAERTCATITLQHAAC